ncbi:DUF1559 family PulG-like putative transporter [Stieleria mannarensis]|uniref:DUF1559 family PulG-like putative transporter n=1 Tax=Stieleria mannarensis TaxID=2755585 RepID=UPI0016014E52|nr:DUF1559 domain-containing protein [Rhodopirellula sp. JC639]
MEYDEEFGETIPSRIEKRYVINGTTEYSRSEHVTQAHSFEPPPAEVFTLEHYGVPEVGFSTGGGWSFTAMLIGVALLFLLGALYFAYKQQREQDRVGAKIATQTRATRGFTLIELLVALSIVSIVLAIALPGVQSAREASRKNTCLNHGRQIALAAQLHHAAFRCLPSNGGFTPNSMITDSNGQQTFISTENFSTRTSSRWGIGEPGLSPDPNDGKTKSLHDYFGH